VSKVLRFLGAVAIAGATVPFLGVSPAMAADTSLTPTTGAYFYAEGIRKPDESPQAPPNVTNLAADRVEAGNLAVAGQAGREDKVSFLLFDVFDVLPGSTVTKALLTLPTVPNDANNMSYGQDPVKVRGCMSGDEGFGGDDGTAIQDAPARKCDVYSSKPAKISADGKSYELDITGLAQKWVDEANDGVALTASEGAATAPFQVVFGPAKTAKLALTYTPAATDVLPPVVSTPQVDVGSGTTDLGGGFTGGSIPAPPADAGFGAVSPPVVTDAAPAPAPAAAPVAAPVTAPANTAAVPVSLESLQPTTAFWLGGILLAAVLVLLSLIMGDPTVPAASTKPSRLSRALADRQRGTTSRPAFGRALPA
jgi:hypothetical protein